MAFRFLLVCAATVLSSVCQAQTCPSNITAPCTIESGGAYRLGADIDATNVPASSAIGLPIAIRIAPGVTGVSIDCDVFSIRHDGGYNSTAIGIYGKEVANVAVSNCNIYGSGMQHGIVIDNAARPKYSGVSIANSVISARLLGIQIRAQGTTVENNVLRMMGRQKTASDGFTGGISIRGMGGIVTIRNNRVYQLENTFNEEVFGIACAYCYRATISGNLVANNVKLAKSWAYWINPGTYTLTDNTAKNFENGFGFVVGSRGRMTDSTLENVDKPWLAVDPKQPLRWTIRRSSVRNVPPS